MVLKDFNVTDALSCSFKYDFIIWGSVEVTASRNFFLSAAQLSPHEGSVNKCMMRRPDLHVHQMQTE